VGTVQATDGTEAATAARRAHGDAWLEMVAIPRQGISWAIREDGD
jgi:hypothetical protein